VPRGSLASVVVAALGCAGGGSPAAPDYLRYVAYDVGFEHVLLRWQEERMPLRVYLPAPPPRFVSDPEAVHDAVRDGITDWSDAAGPGVPSFRFVDDPGDADIPIVWDSEPTSDFIAYCLYDVNAPQRRFGVARILVTARRDGREVPLEALYLTVLHEMGHALGLAGHSPEAGDVMYRTSSTSKGLTARDRETLRLLYSKPNGTRVVGARSAD